MWLNLRDVSKLDKRYSDLLDQCSTNLAVRVPGFDAPRRGLRHPDFVAESAGLLSCRFAGSVPLADRRPEARHRLSFHAAVHDAARISKTSRSSTWNSMCPTRNGTTSTRKVFELAPGELLSWPLNAPHRVEHLDCLNVSMTISYTTEDIRRLQQVNLANGILRHRFGMPARAARSKARRSLPRRRCRKRCGTRGWSSRSAPRGARSRSRLDPVRLAR